MNSLFPLPLYTFLKLTHANGGLSGRGWRNLAPWLVKTVLFEPLRWIELAASHKQVEHHTITQPPVFILGFYRSGTTYLQQLFMQDKRFGFTSTFQMIFPEIMLCFEKLMTPALESATRLFKVQNPIHRIPLTWHSPGEEDVAMTTAVHPTGAQWGYFFPQRMNEYFEHFVLYESIPQAKAEEWKRAYLLLVKKLSLANQERPLVLKSPPNTARVKLLLSLFPDARFIFIHRNPYDVYASNKRLWKVVQETYSLRSAQSVNHSSIILDTYSKMMQRYLNDKPLIPAGQVTELPYETFIKEPVESLRQIYASLDLGDFNSCEKQVSGFAARQKSYATLDHHLQRDEIKAISEQWERYIRHWGYPVL